MSKGQLFKKALHLTAVAKFGYYSLKLEQEAYIKKLVVDCEDVSVAVLPTGYGKSLIYQILIPLDIDTIDTISVYQNGCA